MQGRIAYRISSQGRDLTIANYTYVCFELEGDHFVRLNTDVLTDKSGLANRVADRLGK